MKIEFHPDFKIHPLFKAVWPRFKELFQGLRFKPENFKVTKKKFTIVLGVVMLILLVAAAVAAAIGIF